MGRYEWVLVKWLVVFINTAVEPSERRRDACSEKGAQEKRGSGPGWRGGDE